MSKNNYSAINIGPIISTLGIARKPRELWAASFLFSHLMKCIYAEAEQAKAVIISPAMLNFNSKVVLQGCGPVGLMMCAVLRAAGINHVIAVDGDEQRLAMAKKLGAKTTINFREMTDKKDRVAKVLALTDGAGADFAYQCTGAPGAAADIYDFIRRGGGMCEMGFFVNNGEYQVNPHFAMCNKEINLVGSWAYSAEDYPVTMAFLRQCQEMNIPIEDLITHNFPLDKMNEAMEVNVARQGIKICYLAN